MSTNQEEIIVLEKVVGDLGEYLNMTYPNDQQLKKLFGRVGIVSAKIVADAGLFKKSVVF